MDPIEQPQPAPEAETPTPEQTPPPAPAAPAVDVAALQGAYTQSRQQISSWAGILGVSKDATPDQVAARLEQLRQQPSEPVDPKFQAHEQRLRERERASLTRLYGQDAVDALALADEVATLSDPEEIVTRFRAAVERAKAPVAAASTQTPNPTPAAAAPQEQPVPPEARLDLDVPGVVTPTGIAPAYSQDQLREMREGGNGPVDYLRRVFAPRA